ncbi:MAG TPA: hypothetical protein VF424_16265 [Vicinamibacterales bacterium]
MRKENRMDDRAKSPDPDDLTGNTPPTRPMTPAELQELEEEIVQGDEDPDEDVPGPPPEPSAE